MDLKHLQIVDPNLIAAIALEEFQKIDIDGLGFFTREQFQRRWGPSTIVIENIMGKKKFVTFPQFLTRFNLLIEHVF